MMANLDLLEEAVGWLDPKGLLEPRNDSMKRFLADQGEAGRSSLLGLPFEDEDRNEIAAYLAGAAPRFESLIHLVGAGDGMHIRLAMQAAEGGHWVVVQDVSRAQRWQSRALRLERVRLVGALAEGLIHDLNNIMGSLMGLADHLVETTTDDDSREFLRTVVTGTRDRGGLLKSLYRFLHHQGNARERVGLRAIASDIDAMFRKTALHAGIGFELQCADDAPEIRVVHEHLMQAVFAVFVQSIEASRESIGVEIGHANRGGEGGPQRSYGVIRIVDDGPDWVLPELGRWQPRADFSLDEVVTSMWRAVAAIRCQGGLIETGREASGRRFLAMLLPATIG